MASRAWVETELRKALDEEPTGSEVTITKALAAAILNDYLLAARRADPPQPDAPIGYVEEAELPIRGRATLHETPDASRRAVYVEREEKP